jgi:hypothetical protein
MQSSLSLDFECYGSSIVNLVALKGMDDIGCFGFGSLFGVLV